MEQKERGTLPRASLAASLFMGEEGNYAGLGGIWVWNRGSKKQVRSSSAPVQRLFFCLFFPVFFETRDFFSFVFPACSSVEILKDKTMETKTSAGV